MEELKKYLELHYTEYKTFTMGYCFKHGIFYSEDAFQEAMLSLMLYTKEFIEDTIDHYVKCALMNSQRRESMKNYERYTTQTTLNEAIEVKDDYSYQEFRQEQAKSLLWSLFDDLDFKEKKTKNEYKKVFQSRLDANRKKYKRNTTQREKKAREKNFNTYGKLIRKMRNEYKSMSTFNQMCYNFNLIEEIPINTI